ncbi:MAG TPA: hypothetical protein VFX37_15235 [Pseudolabrys sp.]|nr:hypothetical protein [Pseudolabrys sp.]
MTIADLKLRLHDLPGIEHLTMQMLAGRQNYCLNGKLISVDADASEEEAEKAIRAAMASPSVAQIPLEAKSAALLPNVAPAPAKPISGAKPMTSFAASLKAMMDEARASIAQTRSDGIAQVKAAVGELEKAKTATAQVAGTIAKSIKDEAADVLAELGQISNMPLED